MDANPHNQPTDAHPPYQGVVIEQYRGPLLSQPQTRSGISVSHTPDYSAPLFAFDVPPPEWLAEQPQPRRPTRLRRWLTRMFRSDDEVLNAAKRGLGWLVISFLCIFLEAVMATFMSYSAPALFIVIAFLTYCMLIVAIPFFLIASLADAVQGLRRFRRSSQPNTALHLSIATLSTGIVLVMFLFFILFWLSQTIIIPD